MSPETGELNFEQIEVVSNRGQRARKNLEDWLGRVGLPYHSPHKFRHGFAVYSIKMSKDLADLKAISMNLMHANLSITDGVYGAFTSKDVGEKITSLTNVVGFEHQNNDDLLDQLFLIIQQLRNKN